MGRRRSTASPRHGAACGWRVGCFFVADGWMQWIQGFLTLQESAFHDV